MSSALLRGKSSRGEDDGKVHTVKDHGVDFYINDPLSIGLCCSIVCLLSLSSLNLRQNCNRCPNASGRRINSFAVLVYTECSATGKPPAFLFIIVN